MFRSLDNLRQSLRILVPKKLLLHVRHKLVRKDFFQRDAVTINSLATIMLHKNLDRFKSYL